MLDFLFYDVKTLCAGSHIRVAMAVLRPVRSEGEYVFHENCLLCRCRTTTGAPTSYSYAQPIEWRNGKGRLITERTLLLVIQRRQQM